MVTVTVGLVSVRGSSITTIGYDPAPSNLRAVSPSSLTSMLTALLVLLNCAGFFAPE